MGNTKQKLKWFFRLIIRPIFFQLNYIPVTVQPAEEAPATAWEASQPDLLPALLAPVLLLPALLDLFKVVIHGI